MQFNANSHLWSDTQEYFYRDKTFSAQRQVGPRCVSTSLAILTGGTPELFQNGVINTQDPISWSDKLKEWNMKLAYCPTDARKLKFYLPELLALDDLFTLSYYTTTEASVLLGDPDDKGWICGSHIVVMHRDKILDPANGNCWQANDHHCANYHTKRIFRVVPREYSRGL